MLRSKGIADDGPERCTFRIVDGDASASAEQLDRVARLAGLLLAENGLVGRFHVAEIGVLVLELPKAERTYFHNGIIFAALDAFNDPVKNPTLNMLSSDPKP